MRCFVPPGRLGLSTLTVLLALLWTGLGPAPARAEDTADARLRVILDWFVNPDHGPLVVAKALGLFEAQGLDVTLIAPADPNDPPKLVAAGQAELAVSYQPQLHVQVDQGLPLRRIGALVATPLNTLVTLADGPVRRLADLRGRTIGFSVGGFEDALLGAMLEDAGLDLAAVTLVNVNFSLSPALLSGRVDAVIGAFRNFELTQLALEGEQGRAFYPEEHGVPVYDELIYVARSDRTDDPRLAAFLTAVEQATLLIVNHPERGWTLFVEAHPELDDALNRNAWRDTVPRFALAPGALDPRRYDRMARFLAARGLISEALPAERYTAVVR